MRVKRDASIRTWELGFLFMRSIICERDFQSVVPGHLGEFSHLWHRKWKVVAASVVNARLYWRICAASHCVQEEGYKSVFLTNFETCPVSFHVKFFLEKDVWWMNFLSNLFSRIFIAETCRVFVFRINKYYIIVYKYYIKLEHFQVYPSIQMDLEILIWKEVKKSQVLILKKQLESNIEKQSASN